MSYWDQNRWYQTLVLAWVPAEVAEVVVAAEVAVVVVVAEVAEVAVVVAAEVVAAVVAAVVAEVVVVEVGNLRPLWPACALLLRVP